MPYAMPIKRNAIKKVFFIIPRHQVYVFREGEWKTVGDMLRTTFIVSDEIQNKPTSFPFAQQIETFQKLFVCV